MLIRSATAADLPAMIALEREAATAAHWSPDQYHALFEPQSRRIALAAEVDSTIQGFLVAQALDHEFEIENIVVDSVSRRRGVATTLLRRLLDLARAANAKTVFLEVRESNAPARDFYEKLSFRQAGRRADYYHLPPEDAILYRLDLS